MIVGIIKERNQALEEEEEEEAFYRPSVKCDYVN
jgi:hypothetical protein